MQVDEESIIDAFIVAAWRERWRTALRNPSRRRPLLDRLNHCRDLDERYARSLASGTDVVAVLQARGANPTCYVLSDTKGIHGLTPPLAEAVRAAELGGWGTILSCVPGKLGYYCDGDGERRSLLERPPRGRPF